jgi:glycosyltransferase involved in cell wall biosynthesis
VDWVEEGVNGFLVHDEADWVPHLLALTDDGLRAQMSTAARNKAREFTVDKHAHLWERAYRGETA